MIIHFYRTENPYGELPHKGSLCKMEKLKGVRICQTQMRTRGLEPLIAHKGKSMGWFTVSLHSRVLWADTREVSASAHKEKIIYGMT